MNLKSLRYFVVLAEVLHFGRAAQQCGISQPMMSRVLHELEADLGVKLLNRTSREVSLTQAGEAFLASVRQVIAHADMAVRSAKAGVANGIDRLTLGLMIGTEQPVLGRLIAAFKQVHPETRIILRQLDERSIGEALADGSLDIAVAWDISIPAGLARRPLGTVPLSVIVPAGHPLEAKEPVCLADLAQYPVILPDRDRQPIIYDTYSRFTTEVGYTPEIVIDAATMSDVLAMVAGGVGIGNGPIVPGQTYPGVTFLRQNPPYQLKYELVWAHEIPAVQALLAVSATHH